MDMLSRSFELETPLDLKHTVGIRLLSVLFETSV